MISSCGCVFEVRQSFSDAPVAVCQEAGCKGKVKKLFSPPAIIFKGSGFYCTDYRRDGYKAAAKAEDVPLTDGVYASLSGPSYETPAEVRMLARLGADAVGMSTALEAVAARWAGLRVCGVSLITNPGAGLTGAELNHEEVLAAGEAAGPRLARVLTRLIGEGLPG